MEPSVCQTFGEVAQTSSIGAFLIDWQYEEAAERARKQSIRSERGLRRVFAPFLDSVRLWVVLILTGVGVGIIGAYLDVLVAWLSDLKSGHCRYGFYYNQQACCSGVDRKDLFSACNSLIVALIEYICFLAAGETCTEWHTWTESWNVHWIFATTVQWIIYILLGVRTSDLLLAPSLTQKLHRSSLLEPLESLSKLTHLSEWIKFFE